MHSEIPRNCQCVLGHSLNIRIRTTPLIRYVMQVSEVPRNSWQIATALSLPHNIKIWKIKGYSDKKYTNTNITISQKCLKIFTSNFGGLFRTKLHSSTLLYTIFTSFTTKSRKRKLQKLISQLKKVDLIKLTWAATITFVEKSTLNKQGKFDIKVFFCYVSIAVLCWGIFLNCPLERTE